MNREKDVNDEPLLEVPQPATGPEEESGPERAASEESQASPLAAGLPRDLPDAFQKSVAEKQELYDRLLRKQAELENFRKRVQREKEDYLQLATIDLIRALLPVLDGFDRALRQRDPGVPKSFYEGIELIHQEMLGVLGRAGVTPIEAAGKLFDPHLHQAVETVEAEGHRDQEVVEELQRGYKLKHRLLRPAIVKVAATPARK
jgi:molecular chaperone GrpE